jgi:FkbM family methyltransferase
MEGASAERFVAHGARSRLALATARALSASSKLWRQRGLGTIFLTLNGLPLVRDLECTVEFEPGCWFRLPVFEPYWGPTVIGGRPYEPEVVHLLRGVRELAPAFVDCGANWGYYSVLTTSPGLGYRGGVAIEANPATFARLRLNARLNDERFRCLAYAIAARSGERVVLANVEHHAVAHVREGYPGDEGSVEVETITIDDAVRRADLWDRDRLVIKIDVEGQELAALAGARELRARKDHVIVYEDWASTSFSTTAQLVAEGYPIYYVRMDGRCVAVPSVEAARGILASDGRLARPCNLVGPKVGGAFHERLESWSKS